MKPKFGREMVMLLLPIALIGGVARWKTRAPATLGLTTAAISTPTPPKLPIVACHLALSDINLRRWGPLYSQNVWRDEDCSLNLRVDVKDLLLQAAPPGQGPSQSVRVNRMPLGSFLMPVVNYEPWTLSGADGKPVSHPVAAFISDLPGNPSKRPIRVVLPALPRRERLPFRRSLGAAFDLDRVAASVGPVETATRFILSDGRVMPLVITVRPAWFTDAPQTLYLVKARVLPPRWEAGERDGGRVEVTLRYVGEEALALPAEPKGSTMEWRASPSLDGKAAREIAMESKLLYNWSPRFESADGKTNSHAAKDAFVWKKVRAWLAKPQKLNALMPIESYLASFGPRIQAQTPVRSGKLITVRYRLFGWKGLPEKMVFATEIGVPGDGFLKVRVALPGKKTR